MGWSDKRMVEPEAVFFLVISSKRLYASHGDWQLQWQWQYRGQKVIWRTEQMNSPNFSKVVVRQRDFFKKEIFKKGSHLTIPLPFDSLAGSTFLALFVELYVFAISAYQCCMGLRVVKCQMYYFLSDQRWNIDLSATNTVHNCDFCGALALGILDLP